MEVEIDQEKKYEVIQRVKEFRRIKKAIWISFYWDETGCPVKAGRKPNRKMASIINQIVFYLIILL